MTERNWMWTSAFLVLSLGIVLGWVIFKKKRNDRANSNLSHITYTLNHKGFIMKIKYALLSTVLIVVLTLPLFGHFAHSDTTKTDMKHHHMSKMMGKPTIDAAVEGLHMKVWLMTQKHHKKMMKEMKHDGMRMKDTSMAMNKDMKKMKHDGMEMDKATKEAMMAGTHCIMLDASDAVTKKGISDATAKVMIVSPSKKHSSVDLKPMMEHFGSGLTLDEKGQYDFTVNVNVGGVTKTTAFKHVVK
jgi:hypothetical protein